MKFFNYRALTLLITSVLGVSTLSGCSSKEVTPDEIANNLKSSQSWRVTATWDFLMPGSKTRFNGIGWFDKKGKNFIYQDHGYGSNTFMRKLNGKVDAPGDPAPMKNVSALSDDGKKRIASDLFSLDPLERASMAKILLKPKGSYTLYGSKRCVKEPYGTDKCVDIDLTVKFSNKGYPLEVTYNATKKDKSSTQIVFGYQDFGKVDVKIISTNMNFEKMKPPVYTLAPGTK